jgi:hypothetical protein
MDRNKNKPSEEKISRNRNRSIEEKAKEFMTMSQWQNRFGKGRERNGSDGSSDRAGRLAH